MFTEISLKDSREQCSKDRVRMIVRNRLGRKSCPRDLGIMSDHQLTMHPESDGAQAKPPLTYFSNTTRGRVFDGGR